MVNFAEYGKKQLFRLPTLRWIGKREAKREESPIYRFTKTDLNNGAFFITNLNTSTYKKYAPFNFLQVTNKTDQTLIIHTDTMNKMIASGTILSFDEETLPAFRYVSIENASGTNASGDIEVLVQKVKSYRQVIKEKLEKL
ncbi:MAG: hypothetical protein J7L15_08820 [Clostridiales bacterium]|nr:hypothetical protein [Clostridiales bacterium]